MRESPLSSSKVQVSFPCTTIVSSVVAVLVLVAAVLFCVLGMKSDANSVRSPVTHESMQSYTVSESNVINCLFVEVLDKAVVSIIGLH